MSRDATAEARAAFGARLRELRNRAGLTGRALADQTGLHFTKVSRAEHGKQSLTEAEIRKWCAVCGGAERAEDLIAIATSVDSLYQEWRSKIRSGLRLVQEADAPLYARVRSLRAYEHTPLRSEFTARLYVPEAPMTIAYYPVASYGADVRRLPVAVRDAIGVVYTGFCSVQVGTLERVSARSG